MTKLFSMKSLAFAGAAAFAVALAAAPQADAAGIAISQYENKLGTGMVDAVSAYNASILVSQSAVTVTNNKLEYYYSSVKGDKEPTKWTSVATSSFGTDDLGNYSFDVPIQEIAKGKETNIYIAADAEGTNKTGKIACKAAPKIKAAFNMLASGPSITLTGSDKKTLTTGSVHISSIYNNWMYINSLFESIDLQAKDLVDGDEWLMQILEDVADFGGTSLNIEYYSDDNMTPMATAKLKISATPKAPKESLKIAKAFTFKPKNTVKYRTFAKGTAEPENWSVGTGNAILMDTLFGAENVSSTLAKDEFVLNNTMQLQSRTTDPKGKKSDSRITTTTVYASAATPQAVNAVIKNELKPGKTTTTGASITFATTGLDLTQSKSVSNGAVVTLQYKTNDSKSKWTDAKDKAIKFASGKVPSEIYVRVKGVDYAAAKKDKKACYYEAPGHIMTIKINADDPESATYSTTSSSVFLPAADAKY